MNLKIKSNKWQIGVIGFLISIISVQPTLAFPRANEHRGTATTTSAAYTVPFNPSAWCVYNDSTTIDVLVDFVSGTAVGTNDSTTVTVKLNSVTCWRSADPNVTNTFVIAIKTQSSTAAFRMTFFRGR